VANDKTINLKIKVAPTADFKNQKRQIDLLTRSWQDLGSAIKLARENFKGGFSAGSESMRGLKTFTGGIDGAVKKVFNLKNAIAATALGAGAIWLGKSIFEEGAQQIRTRKRLSREFGGGRGSFGEYITNAGSAISFRAGIQDDEAQRALIPFAEQLEAIQAGARFRGMKRPLTEAQAQALKRKNLTFGAQILQRLSITDPDVNSEELGSVLADALAGPEGARRLISTLHLSRKSKQLFALNEKGDLLGKGGLTPAEAKQYGISKKGQFLEQADLVNLLLKRSGRTEEAALDDSKTFSHQVRQIKSTLMDQIGDIGSGALDTLTLKLGQGATAAERLRNYLGSEEGKRTVDGIKDSVVKITEGIANIVTDIPKIGSWLKEHKTLLEILAGAYGVAKIAPTAVGLVKGIGAAVSGARGSTPAMPLYVSNVGLGGSPGAPGGSGLLAKAGLVVGAGVAGYAAGRYLDEKLGVSTKLANALDSKSAAKEESGVASNKQFLADQAANREKTIKALEARGIDRGHAIYFADHPQELVATTNVNIDGQKVAAVVEKHMVKNVRNRTANGAAPATRE
jgi:hypothetical protein